MLATEAKHARTPSTRMAACAAAVAPRAARTTVAHIDAFNRSLKLLVTDLSSRYPEDATVARAHKRTMTVIALDPLFAMTAVGQYLYDYREQVYGLADPASTAESFFLDNSYDAELRAGVKQEKVDLVKYILPKVKECVRGLGAAEKQQYKDLVIGMLDSYVEYLSAKLIDRR